MPKPRMTVRLTRDSFLFALGVLGVVWETVVEQSERPTLLILFAACMGFPVFLHADERKRANAEPTKKNVTEDHTEDVAP